MNWSGWRGEFDDHHAVQAFARHRQEAERRAQEQIVAWLIDCINFRSSCAPGCAYYFADAISRSEYKVAAILKRNVDEPRGSEPTAVPGTAR